MQNELKEILDYDPETGLFRWRDYPLPSGKARRKIGKTCIGSLAGHTQKMLGYIQIRYNGKLYLGHRLAWLYVHGEMPKLGIDHINGDPADNRIENLRLATQTQNNGNARRCRNNKTGFKGVCRQRNSYCAYIRDGGKSKYLGSFRSAEEAHEAYLAAAKRVFGEFARAA